MHSVEAAARSVAERIARLAAEDVPIREALGRFAAADLIAPRSLPSFDNSAMDGYAVRHAELPGTFTIAGAVGAGQDAIVVPPGHVARILTGAPMPPELDTVVIQEDAELDDDSVKLPQEKRFENVRKVGEDIAAGEVAVPAGTRLRAGELGLCAALGLARLRCTRAPRVAIIATGDELVDVAAELGRAQIVDSSAHTIPALVRDAGGIPTYLGIAKDDLAVTTELIRGALGYDVVITTGGVSVGDRDHVRAALQAAGVELELYKVAMKPGKPFSFGKTGDVAVFGLPGNPVSSYVAFELFVRPALLAMQGAAVTHRTRVPVTLDGGYKKSAGRTHFLRARVERHGERLVAFPHPKQGSAILSSLVGCNALVECPAEMTEITSTQLLNAIMLEAV